MSARQPSDPATGTTEWSLAVPVTPRWGVRFWRLSDRFAHGLGWEVEGEPAAHADHSVAPASRCWLEAITTDRDAAWPASPPLQQVDGCTLADGRSGLVAVGMAGRGHWSLAVEADDHALRFEFACRSPVPPVKLGAAYQVAESVEVRRLESGQWQLTLAGGRVARIVARPQSDCNWDPVTRHFEIHPIDLPTRWPATVAWGFDVQSGH